jgi:hypothetical protein
VLALPERKVELLFVTLDKREGYHERIAYHDYAISPSASTGSRRTRPARNGCRPPLPGESGQRLGLPALCPPAKGDPYRACGPVLLERAEGDQAHDHLLEAGGPTASQHRLNKPNGCDLPGTDT